MTSLEQFTELDLLRQVELQREILLSHSKQVVGEQQNNEGACLRDKMSDREIETCEESFKMIVDDPREENMEPNQARRLASLDVFRGFTIIVMILVDNAGGIWPVINHSPWNGVTLADLVMPFFLFIVGVAMALTYKRITNKVVATQSVIMRVIKLFALGVMLQGGYYHGLENLSYGVDLKQIRWCGILQRIAFVYLLVALCEIWAPRGISNGAYLGVFKIYSLHWAMITTIIVVYVALLYGIYVPDWEFAPITPSHVSILAPSNTINVTYVNNIFSDSISNLTSASAVLFASTSNLTNAREIFSNTITNLTYTDVETIFPTSVSNLVHVNKVFFASISNLTHVNNLLSASLSNLVNANNLVTRSFSNLNNNVNNILLQVKCGTRGQLGPACNAAGYIDRYLLGISHLKVHAVYQRVVECSVNSPNYGSLPVGAPAWCQAPFDPEGILSSLSAMGSCFIGLHFGHVLLHHKGHIPRVWHWILPSFGLLVVGMALNFLGMPMNKPLYSFSYLCFTAGSAGALLTTFYLLVDVYGLRRPTLLLEWMGMNSLFIFVFVASGVLPAIVQGFYWRSPLNNLIVFIKEHIYF